MTDLAPELLEKIQTSFTSRLNQDKIIAKVYGKITDGKATYEDAQEFAARAGELLASELKMHISADDLPDGRMNHNIAWRVLGPLLSKNYNLAADVVIQVQESMNKAAGIGLKAVRPQLNADRATGIINKVSGAEHFEDVAWVLDEPIVNFTQSVVDDAIRENVKFQARAGLRPKVTRIAEKNCCAWCADLAGTYSYGDEPDDFYRRHEYCRCLVLYDPRDGSKQNVHSKRWMDPRESGEVEKRKAIGLSVNRVTIRDVSDHVVDQMKNRNVPMDSILDALNRPLDIKPVKYDDKGRPSFVVVGRKATVAINPETGILTTTYPTHTKTVEKLLKEKKG